MLSKKYLLDLTYHINGAAIEVHKILGPGLLESVYQKCLKNELDYRGIEFKSELKIPVEYKGIILESDYRCDLLVENAIVVELKAVDYFIPIFDAQLLTYMKILKMPKGILFNFNVVNLYKDGQRTLVNEHFKLLKK